MSIAVTVGRSVADAVLNRGCMLLQMVTAPPADLDPGLWVAIATDADDGFPARLVGLCHVLGWLHKGPAGELLQSHHWRTGDGQTPRNLDAHGERAAGIRYENRWHRRAANATWPSVVDISPLPLPEQVSRWWDGSGCAWLITSATLLPRPIVCDAGPADAAGLWRMPGAVRTAIVDQMGWGWR